MEELTIKSLSAVMAVSARGRSFTLDQLLGTALEELLKALDDTVLGWICLAHEQLPDGLIEPAVTARPQRLACVMAVRHASRTAPEAATIICSDCPGLQVPSGADPPPDYSVTDHCSQPALSKLSAGARARVPLFAQDRPIGVLNLAKARSAAFSAGELLFLQTIASQVSIALENACLIRETQTRLQETATLLEAIEKAAMDGANMVRRLQHFTCQRRKDEFFQVDLNQIVKDALAITETKWKDEANLSGATIDIVTSYGKVQPVMGNVSDLREVLTNIIFNAVETMPKGGRLTVKTEEVERWVSVSVSDTGMGMIDAVKARIFDPFFTTKGLKGTGLGLSVSYGIIKGHHGEIDVQTQLGQGTTMLVRLPVPSKPRSAPEQKSTPTAKPGRILVIDDDEFVRTLLSDVLRAAGHTVVQAAGGKEGLHRFHQDGFDLVLTDLGMPECSGWEVAAAVKKMAPQTPVALITGWELTLDRGKLKEAGVDLVLNKPFHVVEVRRLVAEALTLRETI